MGIEYLYIAIVIASILDIVISVVITKRDDLERFQKIVQITIVWLIPFIAAIGFYLFYRHEDENTPSGPTFGGGSGNQNGMHSADG